MPSHNYTNSTKFDSNLEADINLAKNVKMIMCITCIIAVVTNLKVFTCIHWIRRPITPVLKISLSLALADSFASCISAVFLFSEDYITYRLFIIMDMIRLCFVLVTVFHLLGLAFSHYMGIHKPLHNNSRLSQKSTSGVLTVLWTIPTLFIVVLYTATGGFSFWLSLYNGNLENSTLFIHTFRFRMIFSSFIVVSMMCIIICYFSILLIIERQRRLWKKYSFDDETLWKRHSVGVTLDRHTNHVSNRLKNNFKAVCTTLIIMGSCAIGWIPALTIYTIACSQDCVINGIFLQYLNENYRRQIILLRFFDNEMLFLKMIVNPIIYSIRMKEIQDGTTRMYRALVQYFNYKNTNSQEGFGSSFAYSSPNIHRTSMKLTKRCKTDYITYGEQQQNYCKRSFV